MSVAAVLTDWKRLASSQLELNQLKKRLNELQSTQESTRQEFEKQLGDLESDEREAILAVMSVYEQGSLFDAPRSVEPAGGPRNHALQWLINKVGNEGVEGIAWPVVQDAWQARYPDSPAASLFTLLKQHQEYFVKSGDGKQTTLHLTPEGQSRFLNN